MNLKKTVAGIGLILIAAAWGCGGKGPAGPAGPAGATGPTGGTGLTGTTGAPGNKIVTPASGSLVAFSPASRLGNGVSNLYSVNPATGQFTLLGTLPIGGVRPAFDPAGGVLWLATNGGNGRAILKVDLSTSAATYLTDMTLKRSYSGLAFSPNGTLLANGYDCCPSNGALMTVDKTTGVPTLIGSYMDGAVAVLIEGMAFSPSGTLIGVDAGSSQLYTINLALAGVGGTVPVTPVGAPGACTGGAIASIAFYNGTIYGINNEFCPDSIYSYNLATGACTRVSSTLGWCSHNQLATAP